MIAQNHDLSLRNAPTVIRIPENIFHSEKKCTLKLTQTHLTRSYEITNILLLLCRKPCSLNDLLIMGVHVLLICVLVSLWLMFFSRHFADVGKNAQPADSPLILHLDQPLRKSIEERVRNWGRSLPYP